MEGAGRYPCLSMPQVCAGRSGQTMTEELGGGGMGGAPWISHGQKQDQKGAVGTAPAWDLSTCLDRTSPVLASVSLTP